MSESDFIECPNFFQVCDSERESDGEADSSPSVHHRDACVLRRETEVAILGNGPSSIFLSLVLSGYWPYFTGHHPDSILSAKLSENVDKSILEQDLEELSESLEGRSNNPVALLVDALLRPNADIGEVNPSALHWKYDPSRAVPHVVIGRGNPGGSWQYMDPNTQTLSFLNWLELPLYTFEEWEADQKRACDSRVTNCDDHVTKQACMNDVARYYHDYVTKMNLTENFISDTNISRVTGIEKIFEREYSPSSTSSLSSCSSPPVAISPVSPNTACSAAENSLHTDGEWEEFSDICSMISDSEDCGIFCHELKSVSKHKWCLMGSNGKQKTCIRSEKLVLACGVSGNQRWLKIPGEDSHFLTHSFPDFVKRIHHYRENETVLVVGAGLSAAEAVLLALKKNMKVVHVFHRDPYDHKLIFNKIPKSVYPQYDSIHRLMQGKEHNSNYIPYAQSEVTRFQDNGFFLEDKISGHAKIRKDIVLGGIFIGTDAELNFLPRNLVSKLGNSDAPISAQHNPVYVNPFTSLTEVSSLYAIGSLVGDNFVRFGVGSALGAAKHITNS